jgi:hypothetical protein
MQYRNWRAIAAILTTLLLGVTQIGAALAQDTQPTVEPTAVEATPVPPGQYPERPFFIILTMPENSPMRGDLIFNDLGFTVITNIKNRVEIREPQGDIIGSYDPAVGYLHLDYTAADMTIWLPDQAVSVLAWDLSVLQSSYTYAINFDGGYMLEEPFPETQKWYWATFTFLGQEFMLFEANPGDYTVYRRSIEADDMRLDFNGSQLNSILEVQVGDDWIRVLNTLNPDYLYSTPVFLRVGNSYDPAYLDKFVPVYSYLWWLHDADQFPQ